MILTIENNTTPRTFHATTLLIIRRNSLVTLYIKTTAVGALTEEIQPVMLEKLSFKI